MENRLPVEILHNKEYDVDYDESVDLRTLFGFQM